MPITDALQPPLSSADRKDKKAYGGWTSFMQLYALKPYDNDDISEAKANIGALASFDGKDGGNSGDNTQSTSKDKMRREEISPGATIDRCKGIEGMRDR